MQFGVLESQVAEISAVPKEDTYLILFQLPDSMVTTYRASIPLRQEMPGSVRIITEERRMLERIFDRVADLAESWGATLHDGGEVGHLNSPAGFGPWPKGLELIAQLAK